MKTAKIPLYTGIIISILIHAVLFISFAAGAGGSGKKSELLEFPLVDSVSILPPPPPPPVVIKEIIPEVQEVSQAVIIEEEEPESETPPESENTTETVNTESGEITTSPTAGTINFLPFYKVDEKPVFLHKDPLRYPIQAKRRNIEGVVIVEASIDSSGEIINLLIIKEAGYGFDEEALRMLSESTFSPAIADGKPAAVKMRFTIRFQLE